MTWTMMNAMNAHAIQGFEFQRMGSTVQMGTRDVDPVFACADGHLVALPTGTVLNALLGHIAGDGLLDGAWLIEDWETFDQRYLAGEAVNFTREEIRDLFARYFVRHTKAELFEFGYEAGVTLAPINTVADLTRFDQLDAREAWQDVQLPNGQQVKTPGIFCKFDQAPMVLRYPPPRLDEHGDDIRAEAAAGRRAREPMPAPDPGTTSPSVNSFLTNTRSTWALKSSVSSSSVIPTAFSCSRSTCASRWCVFAWVNVIATRTPSARARRPASSRRARDAAGSCGYWRTSGV
jgi:hypothetical protein